MAGVSMGDDIVNILSQSLLAGISTLVLRTAQSISFSFSFHLGIDASQSRTYRFAAALDMINVGGVS